MTDTLLHLRGYWAAGGLLLVPIAAASFGIWICFARSREALARTLKEGREVEAFLEREGTIRTTAMLTDALHDLQGGVAAMLRLVVGDILTGIRPMDAFAARERECMEWLSKDFGLLAVFTTIAPLLGLLGTVMGMIATFEAVAVFSGSTETRVAAGISRALITTQFGLIVALPGLFGLARLRRMLRNTEVLLAGCRARLLDAMKIASEGSSA